MNRLHPYNKYENTKYWRILKKALNDLQKNQDIEITTVPEYVIGYLCKSLYKNERGKK